MEKIDRAHQLFLLAATVAMEAEGESYRGKLGVAYVAVTRAEEESKSIDEVVLKPFAFSAWNTRGRKHRMQSITDQAWFDSEKAAVSAFYGIEHDPTEGATHYLNIPLTRKIRGGSLPRWVGRLQKTVVIGDHTFFKEKVKR